MKTYLKPVILVVMVAILATLIVIPSSVYAKDPVPFPGYKTSFNGLDACACPNMQISCACLMFPPVD